MNYEKRKFIPSSLGNTNPNQQVNCSLLQVPVRPSFEPLQIPTRQRWAAKEPFLKKNHYIEKKSLCLIHNINVLRSGTVGSVEPCWLRVITYTHKAKYGARRVRGQEKSRNILDFF